MSKQTPEDLSSKVAQTNVCFINPALLPEWFWLPTAHLIEEKGLDYSIPPIQRGDASFGVEQNVDIIEATMEDKGLHYVVSLSRGIEFAIRYMDRLAKRDDLNRVLGWMVISSVGPRGYQLAASSSGLSFPRHTRGYSKGISTTSQGLEVIDPKTAEEFLLHDIHDADLRAEVVGDLLSVRPLTRDEVASVPSWRKRTPRPAWYIGKNDKVDNTVLSSIVARFGFGVKPTYTEWGHVGPLSHPAEVADAIMHEIQQAHLLSEKGEQS